MLKPSRVTVHSAHPKKEDIVKNMNSCCLCGHRLTFLHVTNFTTLEVKEKALCKSCGIKMKENEYPLQ